MTRGLALCLSLTLLLTGSLAACDTPGRQTQPPSPRRLIAVTTLTVLADLIERVGGDKVQVKALVRAGGDVHTYQPTPEDIKAVSRAGIIFYNGAHLEDWIDGTIRSAGKPGLPVVVLSDGLPMITGSGNGPNPHLWLDVTNAKTYVERIRDSLGRIDGANLHSYTEKARAYLVQLDELDAWIRSEVEKIPPARRKLVTFHDAFPYFARRYGFRLEGFVVASPGKEPSARDLTVLVRRIKREQVPAVFAESQFNPKAMEVLARDTGITVITNLYNDSLSSGPEADSYIALMKHNVSEIVTALSAGDGGRGTGDGGRKR